MRNPDPDGGNRGQVEILSNVVDEIFQWLMDTAQQFQSIFGDELTNKKMNI